jgi:PAS domain S-box-containing protein
LTISPVLDAAGTIIGAAKIVRDITERKRAEASLRESEVRYRALFNESADGILIADIETKKFNYANPALCRLLGYTEEELRTMGVPDIHPKDAVPSIVAEFEAQIREDKTLATNIPCIRKDGSVVRVDITRSVITVDGRPCNVGFFRDITARQRAEGALQESEKKYRELVEHANSIILRWTRDGEITFLNEFGQKFFGYAEAEILGRSIVGTIVPARESTGRDLFPLMDQIGANPEAFAQSINENMRRNGERVWVSWTNKLVLDEQDQVKEILSIGSDITERKRTEEALRESQAFYHSLVDQLPAGVFRKDREGRYVFVSPWFCRLKGIKAEEFLGKTPREVAASETAKPGANEQSVKYVADGMDHHALIMQTGNPIEVIEEHKDATGRKKFLHALKIPVFSTEGKVIGTQGVVFDITALKQAEETVRKEQALFTDLITTIPDHIYFKDRKSRFVRINDAMAKRFGMRSPDEAVGKTDFDVFSEEHARQAYEDEQRVMSTGDPLIGHVEKETWPDGHVNWVSTTKVPLRDADGKITGLVGISRDITEHKKAEDGIHISASLLRATLESTADGILVVDAKGKVLDFNKQFGEMWRLPESVLATGQDQKLLDYALEQLTAPEDFLAKVRELYAQPAKESFDTLQFKDGRVFERFSNPQRIGDRIVGRVWSFRDVTKRVQAEARNREQAALLDNANDAIYVTTLDYTILYWNRGAERTYGWTSAEALNRRTTELISPDPAATKTLTPVLLKQGSWSGERRQIMKNGGIVEVFSRLTLVRNEQDQPQSVFAINTDITEKKQLEAQFLRAQRLESIGALASGIAHDLNNVLAPILIGAPLLRGMITDQTARHLLKTMETSAQRGADIVRQVLTFARGVEGERVPVQPRHLLAEMEKLAAETFPKDIRLESDAAADLWPVLGDATQLHQALMNLCINARDAMPGGGVLTLQAANIVLSKEAAEKIPGAQPGSFVCLRVTDTGTGIPPEIEAKIFEPFFTTKGVGKGTGLGLSTVLGIVHSHGGFVRVASKVGQGSTFELFLPATTTEQMAVKSATATPWPRAHGEGILVVDDEAAVREVARQALTEFGYRVITTGGGVEALKIFRDRRQEIQLVLTDMMMPEMDGPTLVAALRVLDPAVKIIGTTGMSDTAGMSGLKALALSAMLAKPFTIEKLFKVVREALPVTAGHERTVPDGGASRPAAPR